MSRNWIFDLLILCIGNLLVAIAATYFVIPFDILTGGVAGLAIALKPFLPISETMINNGLVILLFILGYFVLGKSFAAKTLISSILYPLFVTILSQFPIQLDIPPLLASIYVGLLMGVGVGMVIRIGASTGGMDIPPLIMNQLTGIETSKFILLFDGATVALGLLNYPMESMLTGLISIFLSAFMVERIETSLGSSHSMMVQIISEQWQSISSTIQDRLERGVTIVPAYGGYKGDPKQMILVVIDRREYSDLLEIIDHFDKHSFVIATDANQVYGEGFKLSLTDKGKL